MKSHNHHSQSFEGNRERKDITHLNLDFPSESFQSPPQALHQSASTSPPLFERPDILEPCNREVVDFTSLRKKTSTYQSLLVPNLDDKTKPDIRRSCRPCLRPRQVFHPHQKFTPLSSVHRRYDSKLIRSIPLSLKDLEQSCKRKFPFLNTDTSMISNTTSRPVKMVRRRSSTALTA